MIKGVIFDMDGVLVDNKHVHLEAFMVFFAKYGIPFSEEIFMPFFGMTNDEIMGHFMPNQIAELGIDSLAKEKEATYREVYAKAITPVVGLVEFIKDLKSNGVKIAVGSSGPAENVSFVLENCGITQYFDAVANGDMVTRGKPDPEVFLLGAKLLNLPVEECLVIEDSFAGIEAARRAGMKVIAMATTFTKEQHKDYDILVSDFTELNYNKINNI